MRNELDDLKDPSQGTSYRRDMILQKFYKRFYPRLFKSGIWMDQMVDEYLLYNDRDALQDEFGGMKREFEEEPWMAYFILEALRRLKEYRPTETDPCVARYQKEKMFKTTIGDLPLLLSVDG